MSATFDLQEEVQSLQENDIENYEIKCERNPADADFNGYFEGAIEAIANNSEDITDQETFDVFRSILKHSNSDAVEGTVMNKLLDSISSGLQAEFDATMRDVEHGSQQDYMSHKEPLEMYVFLLQWFVTAAEKVKATNDDDAPAVVQPKARKGRGGKAGGRAARAAARNETWTWVDAIPNTLALICRVLRLQTQRIWTTTAEREAFVGCLTRPAYHITESEQYMKIQEVRLGVYKVICLAVKHHGHALGVQIHIMQSLQFWEHLSEPMAECLNILAKEFDHAQLGDDVLREIAGKTFNAADNKGPRAFSRFLVKFAELAPRSVLKQLSLLLRQLDSDAYPMRIGIVEALGCIISELCTFSDDQDQKQTQRQINGLFDLLLERLMDLSSYVRTKVLSVLARFCELFKHKFPKQRLSMTRVAVVALGDKAATVRKNAVALLVKLVVTHPYLTHGGHLEKDIWGADHHNVSEQLAKLEGGVGKAVERNEEDERDGEGDQEGDTDHGEDYKAESPKKTKKTKRSEIKDDGMDVDEDAGGQDGEESENEEGNGDDADSIMSVDDEAPRKKRSKTAKLGPRKSQLDVAAVVSEQEALAALEAGKLLQLQLLKKYHADAVNFIEQIESALDKMCELLGSKNQAEVLEAIDFFRVAQEYRLNGAEKGIKQMIHLIWSKDNNATSEDGKEVKGVRSRLLETYRGLYFDPIPGTISAKDQINRITKNMIERTYEATLAELTSLEEMMRILMDEDHIHHDIVMKLWEVYGSDRVLPKPQRRGTIIILGMLALAKRSVVNDKVDLMLQIGLGPIGKNDFQLVRYTCVALQRLNGSAKKVKGSLIDNTLRVKMDSPIFHRLQAVILEPCRSKEWFGVAEQAINTIYALGDHPDMLCDDIIKKLTMRVFGRRPMPRVEPQSQSQAESQTQPELQREKDEDTDAMDEDSPTEGPPSATGITQGCKSMDLGDAFELSQLLFIVGHVAIKQLVYLELVEKEMKRQKDEKHAAEKLANKKGGHPPSKDGEELDQVAGNAEDEIGDRIAAIRETEMLYGPDSLLAVFGPMLVQICGSPHKFKNKTLRAAATLSFSKFLCVSSQFCDHHHSLLFRVFENSRDANIRSNIVIALGDVAVSFSSIIDENNNELYKGLSDKDLVVKKNTLMVLTHLILNGMIKVKGQLGELAKCIEDPEKRISELAKLFFKELSTKENAIYNNLPDVISHLSTGEHAVEEKTFQSILRHIFTFIEKEKQAENIVEKLCQRFRLSEDPRQWRDIAFCLSLLPFKSERSVKKLTEGLPFYRDKLHENEVYERFQEILAKARSNKSKDKPDSELDEFEKVLEENRAQGAEDQALEKRVGKKKAAAKKRAARKTRGKRQTCGEEVEEPCSDA